MSIQNKILWIIEGTVINNVDFAEVTAKLIETAKDEVGTQLYWWSQILKTFTYCDIDCYADEISALEHLEGWAKNSEAFDRCATIDRCLVLGNVPDRIKEALDPLSPQYMSFYGGFAKDKPADSDTINDIIWSLEGKITNRELFDESMRTLTAKSEVEVGSLMHWWCTDDDDNFFVLEQYADRGAAMLHLNTWATYGHLFMDSTQISKYRVYSDLSEELKAATGALMPELMQFVGGFSK